MWLVEKLDGGIVVGSLMGFLESSGKTSHTVFHSRSISAMSFCRLKEMVKVIEALSDQRVGRSVAGSKNVNDLWTGNPQWN